MSVNVLVESGNGLSLGLFVARRTRRKQIGVERSLRRRTARVALELAVLRPFLHQGLQETALNRALRFVAFPGVSPRGKSICDGTHRDHFLALVDFFRWL